MIQRASTRGKVRSRMELNVIAKRFSPQLLRSLNCDFLMERVISGCNEARSFKRVSYLNKSSYFYLIYIYMDLFDSKIKAVSRD